ncbi:hypothetical protein DY000_02024370 [Brassica cretica]|uniref:Uncharacterized protein n=1 Tax=Brassica cretica TaxID=69181 RepID=A0ABQ7EAA2_BRACR|nr:hypothetical protein DY000_02024370 [Brassica cretica]
MPTSFMTGSIMGKRFYKKSLSSLPSPFRVITGLELHWMRDKPVGGKEEKNSAIWNFSRRAVLDIDPIEIKCYIDIPFDCGGVHIRGEQQRISNSPPDPIKLLSTSVYKWFLSPPDPIKLTFTSSYKRFLISLNLDG